MWTGRAHLEWAQGKPPRGSELEKPNRNILKIQVNGPKINVEGFSRNRLKGCAYYENIATARAADACWHPVAYSNRKGSSEERGFVTCREGAVPPASSQSSWEAGGGSMRYCLHRTWNKEALNEAKSPLTFF